MSGKVEKLIKVIVWRCISVMITMLVMYIATDSVKEATSITLFLHALLLTGHYFFEVVWEKYTNNQQGGHNA